MSRPVNNRRPQFTLEALEQRRLLAADLRLGGATTAAEPAVKETAVYVSTPVAAASKGALIDAADLNRLDNPAAADQWFEQIGVHDLMAQTGGLVERPAGYDKIDALAEGRGLIGGEVPTIEGLGHADLAGANAQDNGKHASPAPSAANAAERAKSGYEQGGLDTSGKTVYQLQHACVSLDPGAYQAKPAEGGASPVPSNPAFGGQNNHGGTGGGSTGGQGEQNNGDADSKETEDDKKDDKAAPAQEQEDDEEEDDSAEPQGEGGGGDADDEPEGDGSGDGDGEAPPAEPAANEPDYGEGYVDPNDPVMQLARDFTDAYFWSTFWANQNGDATPNPNGDYGASVDYAPRDVKSLVDAPALIIPETPTESPGDPDEGTIDPADDH